MNLSTVLSLNSRSAMCIPSSYIFSTVLSHFSLAPEMHNDASSVHSSMDCKVLPLYLFGGGNFGKQVGCTVLLELCLKFSTRGSHCLEHVG